LINVRSYSEEELLGLANLIAVVFILDRVDSLEEILRRLFKFSVTTQATAWDLEIRQLRPRTAGHTSNFKTSVQFGT
jgi:hypothetical protein